MTDVSDEMLMAYADNQLPPDQRALLDRLLPERPDLRARLEPFAHTRDGLAAVFAPTLHDPIPDRLIDAIARAPRSRPRHSDAAGWGPSLGTLATVLFPQGFSAAVTAALAAMFVAGATAAWLAGRTPSYPALIEATPSGLIASGTLAETLETRASTPLVSAAEAEIVPVLSFRSTGGEICREYRARGPEAASDFAGLACRAGNGTWRIAVHVETPKPPPAPPAEGYRTAGDMSVPAIDAFAETMRAGDVLGAEDEAVLLGSGWSAATPGGPAPALTGRDPHRP